MILKNYIIFHRFSFPFMKHYEGWSRTEWLTIGEIDDAISFFRTAGEEYKVVKCINGDNHLIKEFVPHA